MSTGDDIEAVVQYYSFGFGISSRIFQRYLYLILLATVNKHNEGDDPRFTQPNLCTKSRLVSNPISVH